MCKGLLDNLVHFGAVFGEGVDARTIGDIFVDGFRKGVGFLEHHADLSSEGDGVDFFIVDVLAVDFDDAGDATFGDHIVHAIEAAQEGRFTAARRPNQSGHLMLRDRN